MMHSSRAYIFFIPGSLHLVLFLAEGLVSYSMPQGIKRGSEVDLSDRTYDGREEGGYLSGGLGQLVDGQKGPDNFRLDVSGNGKGKEASNEPTKPSERGEGGSEREENVIERNAAKRASARSLALFVPE